MFMLQVVLQVSSATAVTDRVFTQSAQQFAFVSWVLNEVLLPLAFRSHDDLAR